MNSKEIIQLIKEILDNKPFYPPKDNWDNGSWARVFDAIKKLEEAHNNK